MEAFHRRMNLPKPQLSSAGEEIPGIYIFALRSLLVQSDLRGELGRWDVSQGRVRVAGVVVLLPHARAAVRAWRRSLNSVCPGVRRAGAR